MKRECWLSLLLLAGCATEPVVKVKFDSRPRGAHIYIQNETRTGPFGLFPARGEMGVIPEWDRIGDTPCDCTFSNPDLMQETVFKGELLVPGRGICEKRAVVEPNAVPLNGRGTNYFIFFDFTNP